MQDFGEALIWCWEPTEAYNLFYMNMLYFCRYLSNNCSLSGSFVDLHFFSCKRHFLQSLSLRFSSIGHTLKLEEVRAPGLEVIEHPFDYYCALVHSMSNFKYPLRYMNSVCWCDGLFSLNAHSWYIRILREFSSNEVPLTSTSSSISEKFRISQLMKRQDKI